MLIDAAVDAEVTWHKSRQRAKARADDVRAELSGDAERLARFERLLNWARYWGPALNDRSMGSIHEKPDARPCGALDKH